MATTHMHTSGKEEGTRTDGRLLPYMHIITQKYNYLHQKTCVINTVVHPTNTLFVFSFFLVYVIRLFVKYFLTFHSFFG